jgi:hypothetical protein
MAKIADVFGRVNAYCLSVFLYVLGESSFKRGCWRGGWRVFIGDEARERWADRYAWSIRCVGYIIQASAPNIYVSRPLFRIRHEVYR